MILMSALCFLRCFNTVVWLLGRISSKNNQVSAVVDERATLHLGNVLLTKVGAQCDPYPKMFY